MSQSDTDKTLAAEERSEETRSFVRRVRSATRRKYSPEEKIRIVLEGFRREVTVNDLCRREGIKPHSYYSCTKEFMEADLSLEAYRLKKTAIPTPHDARTIQEAVSPRGTVLVSRKFTTFCRQPGRCRS